jgi:hypothetical protein
VRGLIAAVDLEPFGRGVIAHERTMAGPERDRLELLRAVRANLSPVHAVYRGPSPEVGAFLDESMTRPAAAETTDAAGTRHRIWVRSDADTVAAALLNHELMIADGHHRYAVALAFRQEMNEREGPGPWDRMMMLVIDAAMEDPPVLPVHRAVLASPREEASAGPAPRVVPAWGPTLARAGERVRDLAEILATVRDETSTIGAAWFDGGGLVHRVIALGAEPPAVRALHEGPLRRVGHGRLAFRHDAVAAEEMVRSGQAAAAFFLPPTRVEVIRRVIADGETLPEKSTYFWPKPLTGLVVRSFDPWPARGAEPSPTASPRRAAPASSPPSPRPP